MKEIDILKAQIVALKELLDIKDQTIQALRYPYIAVPYIAVSAPSISTPVTITTSSGYVKCL